MARHCTCMPSLLIDWLDFILTSQNVTCHTKALFVIWLLLFCVLGSYNEGFKYVSARVEQIRHPALFRGCCLTCDWSLGCTLQHLLCKSKTNRGWRGASAPFTILPCGKIRVFKMLWFKEINFDKTELETCFKATFLICEGELCTYQGLLVMTWWKVFCSRRIFFFICQVLEMKLSFRVRESFVWSESKNIVRQIQTFTALLLLEKQFDCDTFHVLWYLNGVVDQGSAVRRQHQKKCSLPSCVLRHGGP